MARDDEYVYAMAVVERLTGVTRRRIRYYEKAGLVRPSRTKGGHRLYSPGNIDTLLRVRALVDSGITTMEAVRHMMAAGLDRDSRPLRESSRDRWTPQAEAMGDAAMRVMRPVQVPNARLAASPETDSPGYFRRVNLFKRMETKQDGP